jgi:hypothetical protein
MMTLDDTESLVNIIKTKELPERKHLCSTAEREVRIRHSYCESQDRESRTNENHY